MRSVMIGLVAVLLVSTAWGQEKLDLSGQDITDEQLAEKLKGLPNLKWLNLNNTKITDAGLVHLKGLTNLKVLWLEDTKITDAGLVHLKGLTNLKRLYLWNTKVTDAGVQELKKALPDCEIMH